MIIHLFERKYVELNRFSSRGWGDPQLPCATSLDASSPSALPSGACSQARKYVTKVPCPNPIRLAYIGIGIVLFILECLESQMLRSFRTTWRAAQCYQPYPSQNQQAASTPSLVPSGIHLSPTHDPGKSLSTSPLLEQTREISLVAVSWTYGTSNKDLVPKQASQVQKSGKGRETENKPVPWER